MYLLKTTSFPPKITVNRYLRSEFPRSHSWLTALSLHSQFHRNWSILVDTDHNQACLFIPEFRQGSEDTLFFWLAEFSLSFSRRAIQFRKDLPGPSCVPTASSSLSWLFLQLSTLNHCLLPPSSVEIRQWILLPCVCFSMAKQTTGLIGGRVFYKLQPSPSWSKWKKP